MDEPVSGLDPAAAAEMYRLFSELNADLGMTIVMISHDISSAITYANLVLHIGREIKRDGRNS